MKKGLFIIFFAVLMLCSCEHLFESKKEKLDRLVPVEWDTMVYVDYYPNEDDKSRAYIESCYWLEDKNLQRYAEEGIHFWKDGELVYQVSLFMVSDDEKGVLFSTGKNYSTCT